MQMEKLSLNPLNLYHTELIFCVLRDSNSRQIIWAWNSSSEVTQALVNMTDVEYDFIKADLLIIANILMRDRTIECTDLHSARKHIFI
jgi:hypothetical protein